MRTLRRIGLLGLAGVVVAGVGAPAAHAEAPEACSATGAARALHISVLGQDGTFGATDGTVGAALTALANAAGQLLQPASLSKVALSSDNSTASDPTSGLQKCALPSLPDPLGTILKTDLACSLAKADITKGAPHAIGTAGVASVAVNAQSLLQGLLGNTPLGSLKLGDTVKPVTDQLQPGLDAINAQSPAQLASTSTITDLLNALTTSQTLSLDLGTSTSDLVLTVPNTTSPS